jgi:hypothetical protein
MGPTMDKYNWRSMNKVCAFWAVLEKILNVHAHVL